jgi:hypothetical protein
VTDRVKRLAEHSVADRVKRLAEHSVAERVKIFPQHKKETNTATQYETACDRSVAVTTGCAKRALFCNLEISFCGFFQE